MIRAVEELFERQARNWPLLAAGIESLKQFRSRTVRIDWYDVTLRHIPHRIGSTTAAVDRDSVQKRPCFLCPSNLPPEEEGIVFNRDFILYCNPFPILDRHLTVVYREHRPQAIEGKLRAMLELARALPGNFLIYNGPECGASAPDHFHFQACSRALFPIERETAALKGPSVPGYGRRVVLLRGSELPALEKQLNAYINACARVTGKDPEPLINIALFCERENWTAYLFPRQKHRPSVYFTRELTVSPAAIDLCGVFVVPFESDFERISGSHVRSIFEEVTLQEDQFDEVIALVREKTV